MYYYSPENIFNSFFLQYTEMHGVVFNSRSATLLKRNTIAGVPLSILQYFSEKLFYRTSVKGCKMVILYTFRDSRLEIYKQKSVFWSLTFVEMDCFEMFRTTYLKILEISLVSVTTLCLVSCFCASEMVLNEALLKNLENPKKISLVEFYCQLKNR